MLKYVVLVMLACVFVNINRSSCEWVTFSVYFESFGNYAMINKANIIKGICLKGYRKDPNGLCRPEY